jgi:Domain of unknown function (DUF4389)
VSDPYPLAFTVDEPVEARNRLSCTFRLVLAVPILVVAAAVGGGSATFSTHSSTWSTAGGLLFVGPGLMIVVRQKYPRWWFEWNLALLRFTNRVGAYLLLLRDEYPSTDEEQAVHVEFAYPDARNDLNQWLPLVKWFLAIPHYVALVFLDVAGLVAVIIAWLSILITGVYPPGIYRYVVGLMRWHNRVVAYAFILVTDVYPPFRLAP